MENGEMSWGEFAVYLAIVLVGVVGVSALLYRLFWRL